MEIPAAAAIAMAVGSLILGSLLVVVVAVELIRRAFASRSRKNRAKQASSRSAPPAPPARPPGRPLPLATVEETDDEITMVTLDPSILNAVRGVEAAEPTPSKPQPSPVPAGTAWARSPEAEIDDEEPDDHGVAVPIIHDAEAEDDPPTAELALILISGVAQTDVGQRRKHNEDRFLVLDQKNLFVVADGMGGHSGGQVASQMAVDTIAQVFEQGLFDGDPYPQVPKRGAELAMAIQQANKAIWQRASVEEGLKGMGTTVVSARFSIGKERVYIGHVGDSRAYRLRNGRLTQITSDHTMAAAGMTGRYAEYLSRAVGVRPGVPVDLVIAKPRAGDVYLLCSDGLSKMVDDGTIEATLLADPDPQRAVDTLIALANSRGGRDNVTVIAIAVMEPREVFA